MSSTLLVGYDPQPLTAGREIQERLDHEIDAILDGGDCGTEPTTVVDLSVTPACRGPARQGRSRTDHGACAIITPVRNSLPERRCAPHQAEIPPDLATSAPLRGRR